MTEKEKAEAYDKAIERAKKLHGNGIAEEIFTELKESEDERIKNAILNHLKKMWGNCQDNVCGVHVEDAIAWLENQGDKDKLIQELGEYKVKYTQEVLEKYINNKDDERLRKTTIAFLKDFAEQGYENAVECIDWLEKQGEQKPQGKSALEAIKEENVDNANKVEPKFKVGDWITSNLSNSSNLLRIIGIDETNYEVVTPQGSTGVPSIRYIDKHFHLWTIEDVRDGDVLVHSSFMFDDFIFIYNNTSILQAYCYYSNEKNRFIIEDRGHPCPWNMQEVTPATKEQRELLFQKIKEAGYEWNTEKKRIKEEELDITYKKYILWMQ